MLASLTLSSLSLCWSACTASALSGEAPSVSIASWSSARARASLSRSAVCWRVRNAWATAFAISAALRVAVGRDDVDDVRILVDGSLHLILERLDRLVGQRLGGLGEDVPRRQQRLDGCEPASHRLDIGGLEGSRAIVHQDPGRRFVGLRKSKRKHEHRHGHQHDDERDQGPTAFERSQVSGNVDRSSAVSRVPVHAKSGRCRICYYDAHNASSPNVSATPRSEADGPRVLLVASFVRPHPGGVEDFVDSTRALLEERGLPTRVLACRLPGQT